MAVVAVTELQDGSSSQLLLGDRTYVRVFLVETDDQISAKILAETAAGIPSIGAVLTFQDESGDTVEDINRIVNTITTASVEGKPDWVRVLVAYKSRGATDDDPDDPLLDDPILSITTAETEEPIFLDAAGAEIKNSAGDIFDPPITEVFFDYVVNISFNIGNVTLLTIGSIVSSHNGRLNKTSWLGNPPRTAWMRLEAEKDVRNGTKFWRLNFRVLVRAEGWDRKIIDEGFRSIVQVVDATGSTVEERWEMTDGAGRISNSKSLLDGSGNELEPGLPPNILVFVTKGEIDFNPIFTGINF